MLTNRCIYDKKYETSDPHPLPAAHRGVGHGHTGGARARHCLRDGAYLSLGALHGVVGYSQCADDFFLFRQGSLSGVAEISSALFLPRHLGGSTDHLLDKQQRYHAPAPRRTLFPIHGGRDTADARLALHIDTRHILYRLLSGHKGSGGLCEHSYE